MDQKNLFEEPIVCVIELPEEDIITTSPGGGKTEGEPVNPFNSQVM